MDKKSKINLNNMETGTLFERPKTHHGRNMRRIREIMGIKQETVADALEISQPAVCKLEQKETIDDQTLEKVAAALKVPADAIKNYDEAATVSFISNTFNDSQGIGYITTCTFNPLEKIVELYERMLEMEREKNK